jgi:hypothetical protein
MKNQLTVATITETLTRIFANQDQYGWATIKFGGHEFRLFMVETATDEYPVAGRVGIRQVNVDQDVTLNIFSVEDVHRAALFVFTLLEVGFEFPFIPYFQGMDAFAKSKDGVKKNPYTPTSEMHIEDSFTYWDRGWSQAETNPLLIIAYYPENYPVSYPTGQRRCAEHKDEIDFEAAERIVVMTTRDSGVDCYRCYVIEDIMWDCQGED